MKITVFQSDKGDCLLVSSDDNSSNVLVDGGMSESFTKHVAPHLNELYKNGKELDTVYVSHIDEDHISGILQLMDDAVAWRIYDYQTTTGGNSNYPKPKALRPPKINRVWHNAFHEQVKDNNGEIRDLLAATAAILAGSELKRFLQMGEFYQSLATSVSQAIRLSRRLGDNQLGVSLNPEAKGKLMMVPASRSKKPHPPIKIGNMNWHILGPFEQDLNELRAEWNEWLAKNRKTLARIEVRAREDESRLKNNLPNEINHALASASLQAEELGERLLDEFNASALGLNTPRAKVLGNRRKVTVPNLASLMFLVEEKSSGNQSKTILLTGDGHHADILKGLKFQKKLTANEALFVNILKVQHHGSEHNIDLDFCKRVIADHYIFCGNGAHENPDLQVVKAIVDSRLSADHQSTHPRAKEPFELWFNSSSTNSETNQKNRDHMKEIEKRVKASEAASNGKMKSFFLNDSYFEIHI